MVQETYSGRYFKTCQNDIKTSQGWFGKLCLLGLISFIPVFGQMTVYGYAYEWAHQIAWRVHEPMPKKIYGRSGSKMLRWGWFALVITLLFGLVPGIVDGIGSFISSFGSPSYTMMGSHHSYNAGNFALIAIGGIICFIGFVGAFFMWILSLVACIRMTMYDRFGVGFQLDKIWAMAKHDFGGLMRILGMSLLIAFIVVIIVGIISVLLVGAVMAATIMPLLSDASVHNMSDWAILNYILSGTLLALPLLLVLLYVLSVVSVWIQLLVCRATGYWCQQFNVADWGTKDDSLPFQKEEQQCYTPTASYTPPSSQPYAAPKSGPQPAPQPDPQPAPQPGPQPAPHSSSQPGPQPASQQPSQQPMTQPMPPSGDPIDPNAPLEN